MSERKVDPVAVMQRASLRIAELSGGAKTATEVELQEAIAAVRELVEAARFLMPRIIATNGADCVDRMDAALSKFPTADSEVGNGR